MKEKAVVLSVDRKAFKGKDNEDVSFTSTCLGYESEATSDHIGYVVETITSKADDFDVVKLYQNKIVELEFEFKKVGNTYKKKLIKIADKEL